MLGKDNMGIQIQFLSEMHHLSLVPLKTTKDLEFTENYLHLIAQLVRSNTDLVNTSTIQLDILLQICKFLY